MPSRSTSNAKHVATNAWSLVQGPVFLYISWTEDVVLVLSSQNSMDITRLGYHVFVTHLVSVVCYVGWPSQLSYRNLIRRLDGDLDLHYVPDQEHHPYSLASTSHWLMSSSTTCLRLSATPIQTAKSCTVCLGFTFWLSLFSLIGSDFDFWVSFLIPTSYACLTPLGSVL